MTKVNGRQRTANKTNAKVKDDSDNESLASNDSVDSLGRRITHACDKCEKLFSTSNMLKQHMRTHTSEKPYHCTTCGAKFTQMASWKKHCHEKHWSATKDSEASKESKESKDEEEYPCDQCERSFASKDRLRLHLRVHTGERPYICPKCPKRFSRNGTLQHHIRMHSGARPYTCKICNASYRSVANLNTHMMRHRGQRDFVCELCGKRFTRRDGLLKHLACIHYDERAFRCSICNKAFKGHILAHLRTHVMDKPHKCSECGARFIQSSQLVVHMRRHTGMKPYSCPLCNVAFSYSTVLRLHMRLHTGEKPFKCLLCPSSFVQLPHLKKHMRCIHKTDKPYLCLPCYLFFKTKRELEAHMAEETCKAAPAAAAPTVVPAKAQTSPAEAATAEGVKVKLEAATPGEAATKVDSTTPKKGRKRKVDVEVNGVTAETVVPEKRQAVAESESAKTRRTSFDGPATLKTPTKNVGTPKKKSPTAEKKTPVVEKKIPPAEKRTPAADKKTPVAEKKIPVVEKKTPVVEKKAPVSEKKTPSAEKKTPVTEKKTPVPEKKSLTPEKKLPVLQKKSPVPEKKSTVTEKKALVRTLKTTEKPLEKTRRSASAEILPEPPTEISPRTSPRASPKSPKASPDYPKVIITKARSPTPVIFSPEEEDEESLENDPEELEDLEENGMPIGVMRGLLSTLLTRISAPDRLESFGHGRVLVDKVLCASIESSGRTACRDSTLSERECLKKNIQILLEWTIPKQYMECFKRENRSTEDLLEELTS